MDISQFLCQVSYFYTTLLKPGMAVNNGLTINLFVFFFNLIDFSSYKQRNTNIKTQIIEFEFSK